MHKAQPKQLGFTIVELLVVIVVIGVLAAITIVAYTGISQKATVASLQSDLSNAAQQLKMFYVDNGAYPATISTNCGSNPDTATNKCLKASSGNSLSYSSHGPQSAFSLIVTNGTYVWRITDNSQPEALSTWIPGLASTALAGKYVYNRDANNTDAPALSNAPQWKTANTSCAGPQCSTTVAPAPDPNYPANMVLVDPIANSGVDFSAYPAQATCKTLGGRLPTMAELLAMYAAGVAYGNNSQTNYYWSASENGSGTAWSVYFGDGTTFSDAKSDYIQVRCVKG